MRLLTLLLLLFGSLFGEIEVSGHLDLDSKAFLTLPDAKHKDSITLKQTLELAYNKDELNLFAKLYAQEDYYDTLGSSKQTDRTFMRVDELYLTYDFEDSSIQVGKSIKFWGALELRNIVDLFNNREFRDDLFEKNNKLGSYNASYTHFFDDSQLTLILKTDEKNQKMASYPYAYYIFPKEVVYDKHLQTSNGKYRPSIYLTYSGSTQSDYPIDFAFIYQNGYDSQRYFSNFINIPALYHQNSYLVNKFMTYDTLVVGSTLIKLEALYTDVIDNTKISDYSHIALGVEHTLEDIYDGSSLGLIAEYYKYDTYQSNRYTDLDLFEVMQNDIFLGLRYSFNNSDDASIVGGVVSDFEYNEQVYYLKYESRIFDTFKLGLDYYYVEPSKNTKTAYNLLGRHQRVGLNLAWYF